MGDGKTQAIKGSLWTLGTYGLSQVLRLGSNLVLAYLLFPEAFGLMALVNVFLQGLQMFSDVGIGPSIIQNKRGTEPVFLRTAYTIQILRGVLLWLVTWAIAAPVATFYAVEDPSAVELAKLLPVAGLTALIGGFCSPGVFVLNREMRLGRVNALEFIPQLFSIAVMVGWAAISPSVWALVAGGVAFSLVRLVLSHLWNPGLRDRPGWDPEAARELIHFGRWIFLSTIVSFFAINLDRLLLGRLLTLDELGIYSIGFALAQVAIHVSVRLSSLVIFPLLSRHQDDPARLVTVCARARSAVLWASGAVCTAFAIGAPWFFSVLYDERYEGAGPICRWLAVYCWAQILVSSMDRIPLALGKPRTLLFANLIVTGGMLFAVAGYRPFGLPGFIVGMTMAQLFAHAFLVATLPAGRSAMTAQSATFTLAFLAYALPVMAAVDLVPPVAAPIRAFAAAALAGAIPLAVAGLFVYRMMKSGKAAPS